MHHDVVPLVRLCESAAAAAVAAAPGEPAASSTAAPLPPPPPAASVREAAHALAKLARHPHARIDLAQCGTPVALGRLAATSGDVAVLRSCVAGLAALTCFEGISAQVEANAPAAIEKLVQICAGELGAGGDCAAGPALLRNAVGAIANLALHPPACERLLRLNAVSTLLLVLRSFGVAEYIVSGAGWIGTEAEAAGAAGLGQDMADPGGDGAAAAAAAAASRAGGGKVGAEGVVGNAAWALRNLGLGCRGARVVAHFGLPVLFAMVAADDVDEAAVANAAGAVAALAAAEQEQEREAEGQAGQAQGDGAGQGAQKQEAVGDDCGGTGAAGDDLGAARAASHGMSVCEQMVASGGARPLVQLAQRLELSLSLAHDTAEHLEPSAQQLQAHAVQQWQRTLRFAHEALEHLSRDAKARLALVEAGVVQMLVRRCSASADASRAKATEAKSEAANIAAERDTAKALAMRSRRPQSASDEATLRCAASALACLASDQEVWHAIASTNHGGAAVWPIVQLCGGAGGA
eukprot:g794.t1